MNQPEPDASPAEIGRVIGAHIAWSKELIAAGTVLQAGRWGERRGIAVIKASDLAKAEALQARDPLVSSGLATYELARLHPDVPLE